MIIISIRQAKNNDCTKDGRSWFVDLAYKDLLGKKHRYHSKKFSTRREAKDNEAEYKMKIKNQNEFTDLSFKDLIQEHYQYQQDKVKVTTLSNYKNMMVYLEPLENIKLESFNIRHFEMWRQFMNSKPISTRYKNGVYKYLKALMNFGTKWYDINFIKVYNKMTSFTNPNERKKEMALYTLEEFQRFLSVETDLNFKCAFQTLFYCGLRNGELRGLTWNDINFNRSTLTINKNIVKVPDPKTGKPYTVTSPKTSSSYRTIPIPNFLLKDLSDLYNDDANYYGFRDSWYVFGNIDPLAATTLLDRKTKNAFMARVKDIRIHDFRHSCASLLIDSGANITLVAKYLGHSKIDETLNTYSHMYQNRLDTIVNIIELQNSKLNNDVIETKPTILLEDKETLPEEESYDYEKYEMVKPKSKDDLVL